MGTGPAKGRPRVGRERRAPPGGKGGTLGMDRGGTPGMNRVGERGDPGGRQRGGPRGWIEGVEKAGPGDGQKWVQRGDSRDG